MENHEILDPGEEAAKAGQDLFSNQVGAPELNLWRRGCKTEEGGGVERRGRQRLWKWKERMSVQHQRLEGDRGLGLTGIVDSAECRGCC